MQKIKAPKLNSKQEKEVLAYLEMIGRGQGKRKTPDNKALAWHEKNKWFGKQKRKTLDALALHGVLLEVGISPRGQKYYRLIDRFFELKNLKPKQEEKNENTQSKQ